MKVKITRFDILLIIAAIISIAMFIRFYADIFPSSAITMKLSRQEIEQKALSFLSDLGYHFKGIEYSIHFRQESKQIRYLDKKFGTKRANQLMADSIVVFYWQIQWENTKYFKKSLQSINQQVNPLPSSDSLNLGEMKLRLATDGQPVSFQVSIDDSIPGANLPRDSARTLVENFLINEVNLDLSNFELEKPIIKEGLSRTDHYFKWLNKNVVAGEKEELLVTLQGDIISSYYRNQIAPESYRKLGEDFARVKFLFISGIILLYSIFVIVTLIKKLKANAISLNIGMVFAIVTAISLLFIIWSTVDEEELIGLILALTLPALFVGFIILPLFAVGDSFAREVWPEKLFTFDAFRKRMILFPQFGHTILHGMLVGFILLGMHTFLFKIGSEFAGLGFDVNDNQISGIATFFPSLFILASILLKIIFNELAFRLLTLSYLRKHLKSIYNILILGALIASLTSSSSLDLPVFPVHFDFLINFISALIIGFTFIRYDFIASLIASLIPRIFLEGYNLIAYGQDFYAINGICFMGFLLGLCLIGLVGSLRTSKKDIDLARLAPPYVSQMAERERLRRELEIARHVQLSFLPKENPSNEMYEVATICIPAQEVGGDYYDFVQLSDDRLGIAIGDVSGKGISAAFYMTLTKGFFKSQARQGQSPREVLIQLNELFYENVERGTFVSIIYGIFDLTRKTFTFARAGHNPVIICSRVKGRTETLCPKGLALGLEKGVIFNKTIEENQLSINKDDLLVFYTDGFTEAMNKNSEEFGETRLQTIIDSHKNVFAEVLLQIVRQHIESFVGKTPQHDDMTMVIVRIK